MAPGIANTLDILVAQGEAQALTIRNLRKLCQDWAIPDDRIAEAQRPLVMDGAVPQSTHDGHTEPMEIDDYRSGHRPTIAVQPLSMGELVEEKS